MTPSTCPFLGLEDDPTTILYFPSAGNYCHLVDPIAPVNLSHQQSYCLSKAHVSCPVFTSGGRGPLPDGLLASEYKPAIQRRNLFVGGLVLLFLIIGLGVGALWINFSDKSSSPILPTEDIELVLDKKLTPDNFTQDIVTSSPTQYQTPLNSNNETTESGIHVTQCEHPDGWILYVVKPNDSLFRLSVVFKVSLLELHRANCLSEGTFIRAGQEIYVPNPPTSTLALSSTPSETPLSPTPSRTQPVSLPRPSATKTPRPTHIPAKKPPMTRPSPPAPTARPLARPTSPDVDMPTSRPSEITIETPLSPSATWVPTEAP